MNSRILSRFVAALGLFFIAAISSSCTTYYDSYGYAHQAVDPGVAVAGALAAGAIGYALADSHDHHYHYRGHSRHYRRHYYPARRRGYCY